MTKKRKVVIIFLAVLILVGIIAGLAIKKKNEVSLESKFMQYIIDNKPNESYALLSDNAKKSFSSEQWSKRVNIDSSWMRRSTAQFVSKDSSGQETYHVGLSHDAEGMKKGVLVLLKTSNNLIDSYTTVPLSIPAS